VLKQLAAAFETVKIKRSRFFEEEMEGRKENKKVK
jgi:hypothetical protein